MKTPISIFLAFFFTATVLLAGCGRNQPQAVNYGQDAAPLDQTEAMPQEAPPNPSGGEGGGGAPGRGRQEDFRQVRQGQPDTASTDKVPTQIIKNAQVRFRVEDHQKATAAIGAVVKRFQGYLGEARESNRGHQIEVQLKVRVPSRNFDTLLTELLKASSYLDEKSVTAQDVTEEYVDIRARLRTKREVERRYADLLRQARNVTEVLEVEGQLRLIREEIESAEGRLKYLRDQVAYSTIDLTYYQPIDNHQAPPRPSFFGRLGEALGEGWHGLLNLVVGLVYLWPFLLLGAGLAWLIRRWARREKPKK
jgi:hypothetical protein